MPQINSSKRRRNNNNHHHHRQQQQQQQQRNNNNGSTATSSSRSTVLRLFLLAMLGIAIGLSLLAIHLAGELTQAGSEGRLQQGRDGEIIIQRHHSQQQQNQQQNQQPPPRLGNNNPSSKKNYEDHFKNVKSNKRQILLTDALLLQQYSAPSSNATTNTTDANATANNIIQHGDNNPNKRNNDKYANDRVYCMIPFIWNKQFYNTIMNTWGKRCDVINFFTDPIIGERVQGDTILGNINDEGYYKHYTEFPLGTFPENVVFVNMTRPWNNCGTTDTTNDNDNGKNDKNNKKEEVKVCRHIWEKMWRSWIHVSDHHSHQAEWFCKVDYDTYFFPDNLKYFVRDYKQWDPINEHHYFGHLLSHRHNRPDMIAGAMACWSRKTLRGIAQVYRDMPKGHMGPERGACEDRSHASEEVSTSLCLRDRLNVTAEPARDEELREYVMLDPYANHLTWNRTEQGEWWFWKGKPENAGQMEDCCAVRPLGVHKYKQTWMMEGLEKQFYGSVEEKNESLRKESDGTRAYVDKVRKAMGIDS